MTLEELYTLSLSFLAEKPQNNDLKTFIIPWVNLLLQEALPYENTIRHYRNEPILEKAPTLNDWQEEIPYCEEIVRVALPYGLASFIFQDDDNEYRTERYRNLYVSALMEIMKAWPRDIIDVYGGECNG